jgi:hypothetical protein
MAVETYWPTGVKVQDGISAHVEQGHETRLSNIAHANLVRPWEPSNGTSLTWATPNSPSRENPAIDGRLDVLSFGTHAGTQGSERWIAVIAKEFNFANVAS